MKVLAVAAVASALVALTLEPNPAVAATIPTRPAVCVPGHPTLISTGMSPSTLDVTQSAKKVTLTLKAKDSSQDITGISVLVEAGSLTGYLHELTVDLKLASGTARRGTWKGNVSIPRWAFSGSWGIDEVSLTDAAGGAMLYGEQNSLNDVPGRQVVTVTSSHPDLTPPTLTAVSSSAASVNTSAVKKVVNVTVKAKDNLSGVKDRITVEAYLPHHPYDVVSGVLKRTSGTATKGVWKGSFTIPRWAGQGTHVWTLIVKAFDRAGNEVAIGSGNAKHPHLIPTLKVTSSSDATLPTLDNLTYPATPVDARAADKKVTVTVTAADTLSGVGSGWVTLKSPSGFTVKTPLAHTAGSTWTAKATIPRCSEPGTWTVSGAITDRVGNRLKFSAKQLTKLGFASTLTVKAHDATPPTFSVKGKVPYAGPLVITFSEPTLWKGTGVDALKVLDTTTFADATGTWTCANAHGTVVDCHADGAKVTTATLTPTKPFGHHVYEIQTQYESIAGIYDTSGNGPTLEAYDFTAS